jgi:hypothetical protein
MSGHVIATEVIIPSTNSMFYCAAGGAAIAAAVGIAVGVKAIVDDCIHNAEARRDAEKERISEWMAFVQRQQQENREAAALEELLVASEQKLAVMELGGVAKRVLGAEGEEPPSERARAHMELGRERLAPERAAALLAEFASMLAEAPAAFRSAEGDPCGRLEQQRAALAARLAAGEPLDAADIGGLREAYRDTLAAFLAATRARREWREALQSRIETALDTVLFAEQVALRFSAELAVYAVELVTLRARLVGLCAADEPDADALGMIERRLETLRGEIDRDSMMAAQRRGVAEALTRILGEMGYEAVDDFAFEEGKSMAVATMRIPGGEIVRAALHQNRQLAFEVIHERPEGADAQAPLSISERIHLVRQEKKWCTDVHELFRRMVAEGLQYRVSFEHDLKEDNVKVVVVETAADILRDEEEAQARDEEQRKYLG